MNKKGKTLWLLIVFLVVLVGASIAYNLLKDNANPIPNAQAAPAEEKTLAPDFTVIDKDGKEVKLSDFKGTAVVINCWATWCGYCKEEMPYFEEVSAQMGDDVAFLMIDMVDGSRETEEIGKAWIEENGYTFPIYFDSSMEVANTYGINSLPTTLFIDKEGYLITGAKGAITKELLLKGISMITETEATTIQAQ